MRRLSVWGVIPGHWGTVIRAKREGGITPYRTRYVATGCAHAYITRLCNGAISGHVVITLGRVLSGGYMMRLAGRGVVDPVYSAICQRCSHTYDSQADVVSDKIHLDNVMNQASKPLQEWVSNNEYFNFLYQLAVPVTQNVLGISWNPYTDNMNIVVGEKLIHEGSWRYTKRKILSLVSSVYDPLGWVSPLTVRGKIFLQTLWKEKIGWDQTLNTEQIKVIRDILVDLQRVDEFIFPRHILHEHSELYVFTDASSRAYGAAVYTVNETCQCSNLLISKARVAPCREGRLMIPKL